MRKKIVLSKENDIKKRGWDEWQKLAMKIIGIRRMVDLSDEEKKGCRANCKRK